MLQVAKTQTSLSDRATTTEVLSPVPYFPLMCFFFQDQHHIDLIKEA